MTAQAPSESLHLVRQEPVPFELLPHEGQQLRVGAGWELYWDKRAVHLDGGGPDAVPGVRYVGMVISAWYPWAMLFTTGPPHQPPDGQVLEVTAAKSRLGNTHMRLDSGGDDAGNILYQVDIYACYTAQFNMDRTRVGQVSTHTG